MIENRFRPFDAQDFKKIYEDTSRSRIRRYDAAGNWYDTISPLEFNESSRPHANLVVESPSNLLPFPEIGEKPYFHLEIEPVVHKSDIDKLHQYILQFPVAVRSDYLCSILQKILPKCNYSSGAGLVFGSSESLLYEVDTEGHERVDDSIKLEATNQGGDFVISPDREIAYRILNGTKTTGFEYLSGVFAPKSNNPILMRAFSGVAINRELYSELDTQTRKQMGGSHWDDSFTYKSIHPYARIELDLGE